MKKIFRHNFRKRKPLYKRKIIWISIFFFLISYSIFLTLFVFPFFTIKEIEVLGQKNIKKAEIILGSESLGKNILSASKKKIEETLKRKIGEIEKVKISKRLPNLLLIEVQEREIQAQFCNAECYLVDQNGILFKKTEKREGLLVFKGNFNKNLNERLVEPEKIKSILKIVSILSSLDLKVKEVNFLNFAEIDLKIDQDFSIFFDLEKDVEWQIQKLKVLFEKEITKEKRKDLEYIDLRFKNFVNYKLR